MFLKTNLVIKSRNLAGQLQFFFTLRRSIDFFFTKTVTRFWTSLDFAIGLLFRKVQKWDSNTDSIRGTENFGENMHILQNQEKFFFRTKRVEQVLIFHHKLLFLLLNTFTHLIKSCMYLVPVIPPAIIRTAEFFPESHSGKNPCIFPNRERILLS